MNWRPASILVLALTIAACGPVRPGDRICQIEQLSLHETEATADQVAYFPKGFAEEIHPGQCGEKHPRLSEVEREWYPKHWRAACEPPLLDAKQVSVGEGFTFRLSLLPTFDKPLILRLESRKNGHWLIVKKLSGHGGYDPGIISESVEFELSEEDIKFVRGKLDKMRASRAAALAQLERKGPNDTCFGMLDGTEWILEVVEDGQYDMFNANSPAEGELYEIGEMLLGKSGWNLSTRPS